MENIIYLMKYNVSYDKNLKYKAFRTFEDATKFHRNYKHHLLENAFITHFEIIVLDLAFIQSMKGKIG